ncbi:MAG: cation:proton antiporter [Opitutales bacterium]
MIDAQAVVLALCLFLVTGYGFGFVAEKVGLPKVSAYLLAGVLFSDALLGRFLELNRQAWSDPFSSIALTFIAYIVGSEINLPKLRRHGKVVGLGMLGEALTSFAVVYAAFWLLGLVLDLPAQLGLALAAVSATTAPAATMGVIEEYRAQGKLTTTVLGIVALDDAFGVLLFSLVASLFFATGGENGGALLFVRDIGLALLVGAAAGLVLNRVARYTDTADFFFPFLAGIIFAVFYLSEWLQFSNLLACIVVGIVANNFHREEKHVSLLLPVQHVEDFIFILFFTLAGAHFSPEYFGTGLIYIALYFVARGLGKYLGAWAGTSLAGADRNVARHAGLMLLPQAGVAIGLVLHSGVGDEQLRSLLTNIILATTILYEFLGPLAAKFALQRAGEIRGGRSTEA